MKWLKRMFASQVIEIKNGRTISIKGKLSSKVLADVSDVARLEEIESAEIWIGSKGSISFSREIPDSIHQRLRNVIASR